MKKVVVSPFSVPDWIDIGEKVFGIMIFSCTKFDGSMALNILISILQGGNEFRLFWGRDLFFLFILQSHRPSSVSLATRSTSLMLKAG